MVNKCPGMNPQNWNFDDIKEVLCNHCYRPIEFWKDDVKFNCPHCKKEMMNPNLLDTCVAWCEKADLCLENKDINELKKNTGKKNSH